MEIYANILHFSLPTGNKSTNSLFPWLKWCLATHWMAVARTFWVPAVSLCPSEALPETKGSGDIPAQQSPHWSWMQQGMSHSNCSEMSGPYRVLLKYVTTRRPSGRNLTRAEGSWNLGSQSWRKINLTILNIFLKNKTKQPEKQTPASLQLCHTPGDNHTLHELFALQFCNTQLPVSVYLGSFSQLLRVQKRSCGFCFKTQEQSEVGYMLLQLSILESQCIRLLQ